MPKKEEAPSAWVKLRAIIRVYGRFVFIAQFLVYILMMITGDMNRTTVLIIGGSTIVVMSAYAWAEFFIHDSNGGLDKMECEADTEVMKPIWQALEKIGADRAQLAQMNRQTPGLSRSHKRQRSHDRRRKSKKASG